MGRAGQREEEGKDRMGKRGEARGGERERRALEQRRKKQKRNQGSQRTAVLAKLSGEGQAWRPGMQTEAVSATRGNSPLERDRAFPPGLQQLGGLSILTETALPKSPAGHQLISNRRSFQRVRWRPATGSGSS